MMRVTEPRVTEPNLCVCVHVFRGRREGREGFERHREGEETEGRRRHNWLEDWWL